MPSAGFEPIILAGERPQTYALNGVATKTAKNLITLVFSTFHSVFHLQLYYQCFPVILLVHEMLGLLGAERRFALLMVDDIFSLESFF